MMLFSPSIEGSATIHSGNEAFIAAFVRRIEGGLFPDAPLHRRRYEVVSKGPEEIRFRAINWWTAVTVGLNDVVVTAASGRVHYRVAYRRWASFGLVLSGVLGLILIAGLLVLDVRQYIEEHAASRVPGLSTEQNVAIAWTMAVFWGFVFPWILIAFYKRSLNRLVGRIIAEVDADSK